MIVRHRDSNPSSSPEIPPEIRNALDRFRGRVRSLRVFTGLGITLILGIPAFILALVLDRLFVLSPAARISLTTGTLGIVALAVLIKIVIPLFRPISDRRVARGIEAAQPSLDESLISTLELVEEGGRSGSSTQLMEAVARTTARRVGALEVKQLVDPRPAVLRLGLALAVLLGLLALAALDPRGFSMLANRFFHPGEELPRPSRVTLHLLPGNAVIGMDDDFTVDATVARGSPKQVNLRTRVPGGEWRIIEMEPRRGAGGQLKSPGEFRHEFRRRRHTFEYQALAGDYLSATYRVEVRERPHPELFTITYRFPPYTRRPPLTVRSTRGDLSAVVGAVSDLVVTCTGRPVIARRTEGGAEEAIPLSIEPAPGGGDLQVRARIEIRRDGIYNLYLEDADGISNRGGESYSIRAEVDRPPKVRVLSPRDREVVVEDASRLELQYQGQDDFGVETLTLVTGTTEGGNRDFDPRDMSGVERRFPISLDPEARGRSLVAGTYRWDLATLGLRPGENIPFRILARDGLGQIGASPEMRLRMAFLPDPPEGAGWLAGLKEIQRGLDLSRSAWGDLLGWKGDRPGSLAVDPARADRLSRSSESLLREISRLGRLGDLAASLGRSIPIPSVNCRALVYLSMGLRRFGEREGKTLWMEILSTTGKIREALRKRKEEGGERQAPADIGVWALNASLDRGAEQLQKLSAHFTAIHLSERLEGALERLRALSQAQEEMVSRVQGLQAGVDAGADAEAHWAGALNLQRGLLMEATSLGVEIEQLSKLGGIENRNLVSLARAYLENVVPLMDDASRAVEARASGKMVPPLEEAARELRKAEVNIAGQRRAALERAKAARVGLVPPANIQARLAMLAEAEAAAARELESGGLEAVLDVAAGDRGFQPALALLRSDFDSQAELIENARPVDYESANDVSILRDIFRDVTEGILLNGVARTEEIRLQLLDDSRAKKPVPGDLMPVIADRRRASEVLGGLSRAYGGVEPGVRLGLNARQLDAISGAEESAAWQLRSTPSMHVRALGIRARIQEEIGLVAGDVQSGLKGLAGEWTGDSPAARSLAEALSLLPRLEAAVGEARGACRAGDPKKAVSHCIEAARLAVTAARLVDEARAALPGIAGARDWIRRQIGSLPERVERLARDERGHASQLEELCKELGPSPFGNEKAALPRAQLPPERLAALGRDQELFREEAARISAQAAREAGRLASQPVFGSDGAPRSMALSIQHLDLAAGRIHDLSRGEMLRARRAIEAAARSKTGGEQRGLLSRAAAEETLAAEELEDVARTLRILEQREVIEISRAELKKLLSGPPPAATDPESVKRALEEARAYLDGVLRAAEVLSTRLPEGVLKAELLNCLKSAADKFREALAAGKDGDGARVVALVGEGRALLGEAMALARRIRGEADAVLARAEEENRNRSEQKPMSRELQEVYEELRRIQALREWQARVEAELADLLRDPSRSERMDKMEELARLEEKLAELVGARFMTTGELMELVADLLSTGNEAKRVGEAERRLGEEISNLKSDPGLAEKLKDRQDSLISSVESMEEKLEHAGAVLTINLPTVLIPFWEAEDHLRPALEAMQGAGEAIFSAEIKTAVERLGEAAAELSVLSDLLGIARQRALEEIARREEEYSSGNVGQTGMEAAMDALQRASRELSRGQGQSALQMQQSAMRSLASAAESMRARLLQMRMEPGQEGLFLSRVLGEAASLPGASWDVMSRGDEDTAEEAREDDGKGDDVSRSAPGAFPEEFRELVKTYLRALAGLR